MLAYLAADFDPSLLHGFPIRLPFGAHVFRRRLMTLEKPSALQGEVQLSNGQHSRECPVHVHEVLQLERLTSVNR